MPRAYRPRVATMQRAASAARRMGASRWHIYRPGPFRSGPITLSLTFPDQTRRDITLADAENADIK